MCAPRQAGLLLLLAAAYAVLPAAAAGDSQDNAAAQQASGLNPLFQGNQNLSNPQNSSFFLVPSPPVSSDDTAGDGLDGTVIVGEEGVSYAGCGGDNEVISSIVDPIYGNAALGCNASDSYRIVVAGCLGEHDCVVRASADVFTDVCPGAGKTLSFGYTCSLGASLPGSKMPSGLTSSGPSPSPSSAPPFSSMLAKMHTSMLWGANGELYRSGGRLGDWSFAGYMAGEHPLPLYPVKYNVRDYGARGDGETDDSGAFQQAIAAASAEAARTGSGVAVFIPDGRYAIRRTVSITQSNVVLRGSSPDRCILYMPVPLQSIYGNSQVWAFGGAFFSIVGKRMDSRDLKTKLTDVTANANRGDYRLQVASTAGITPRMWVRLFMPAPGSTARRRLQSFQGSGAPRAGRKLRQAQPAPSGKVSVLGGTPPAKQQQEEQQMPVPSGKVTVLNVNPQQQQDGPNILNLFKDPALQAALKAAVKARWEIAAAVDTHPDKVPAQSFEPNATNPMGMDPMLLASAYYAALAMESEPAYDGDTDYDKAPTTAVMGSLESYLYGNNVVDSGTPKDMFYGKERVRYLSRVVAVGPNWVQFERALPYDVRLKWKPVLHRFAPKVSDSGFENFQLVFAWTKYPEHTNGVKGMNGIALLDTANSWVSNVKIVDADNGVMITGADFVTVTDVTTSFTKMRGTGAMGRRLVNGHHAIWASSCSLVLVTRFDIQQRWYHDLSVDSMTEHTVYTSGKGMDINIDCHKAAVHNNLFTNINTGLGTRTFLSGGDDARGTNSGANTTWWGVRPSSGVAVNLPECTFGPLLNFFGSWLGPSKQRGLLQQGRQDEVVAALETGAGITVSAQAVTPWCTAQSWFVEQVDSGKTTYPADLYAAQVQARKEGRLK